MPQTADQISEALIGRGYFPKELPPPFKTTSLSSAASTLRAEWNSLKSTLNSKQRAKHPIPSHPVLFDMARKGHARRTLSIPNPINQFYLSEEIAKHWTIIKKKIDGSEISITKCEIGDQGRAVPMPPISTLSEKRIILYASQGAILVTDILSFYHSTYTHAVPWALHGKANAKVKRDA